MTESRTAAFILLAATATLVLAFAIKNECTYEPWDNQFQYRHYCYSDILPLYYIRHLDVDHVPYTPSPHDDPNSDVMQSWGFSEYPVLTGYFTWFVAWLTDGLHAYMALTFGLLTLAALFTTLALSRLSLPPHYVLAWAASPALLVHAFTNWDLLAVALAAGGWLAWRRGRFYTAALCFGLGGAAKLYPAFFLPFLFLERWRERDGPGAGQTLMGGTLGFAVPNLAAYWVSPAHWWAIWRFHAARHPDFETPWEVLRAQALQPLIPGFDWGEGWRHFVANAGALSMIVAAAALAFALWFRRTDALAAGSLLVLVFLLTNRVYSPQYTLWALPLLVALRAPWWGLMGYMGADLLNFLVRYRYFTTPPGAPEGSWDMQWAPWSRFAVATRWLFLLALTVALAWRMRRAEDAQAASSAAAR